LSNERLWTYVIAVAAALLIGLESSHLFGVVVGLATLLPLFSHIRHVGLREVFAEPSAATIIVGFYLFVFPLRALVIAASGYGDVFLAHGTVSSSDVVAMLLLASVATTTLIESYYFALGKGRLVPRPSPADTDSRSVVLLATVLASLALFSLVGVLVQYGGLKGAQAAFLAHNVVAALEGKTSVAGSGWELFAVPAVWSAAYVAVNPGPPKWIRVSFTFTAALIVFSALVVYGSRLNALLALIGVWVVLYYAGRRVPTRLILVVLPVAVLLSGPLVSARTSGPATRLSVIERYSRIAGYDVLDVALAIRREPQQVRAELDQSKRWLDLPAYFVPSVLWHGRPNLNARRLGLYVAQDLGTVNDQATGFPSTYVTEGWLIGGWPATLALSVLVGGFLGWARRRLVGSPRPPSPAAVLAYCFVVTAGWTYYKDGDILSTIVGQTRTAVYLTLIMLATGMLGWRIRPRTRHFTQMAPTSYSAPSPRG
jgi:hypothetical protein